MLGLSGVGAEASGHLALGASCSGVGAARSPAGAWFTCPGPDVHSGLSQDVGFHRTLSRAGTGCPTIDPRPRLPQEGLHDSKVHRLFPGLADGA